MDGLLEATAVVARALVGLVFVLAGVSKARAPAMFEGALARYRMPGRVRPAVAYGLPALETLLGVMLLAGVFLPVTTVMALGLLVAFTALTLSRPPKDGNECGCFGTFDVKHAAARNAVLIGVTALAAAGASNAYSLESGLGALPALALVAVAAAGLLAVARGAGQAAIALRPDSDGLREGRRSFLGKLAVLGAGSVAAATLTALRGAPRAEAACWGCTSCGYAYYWIGCGSFCCAYFWQVPQDYCEPYCNVCGTWQIVLFCGYPQCC